MKPKQQFRVGTVTATIWQNTSQGGKEFATIQFERSYKDKDDCWKKTNSLNVNDIPKAMVVLGKAYEYLSLKERTEEVVE